MGGIKDDLSDMVKEVVKQATKEASSNMGLIVARGMNPNKAAIKATLKRAKILLLDLENTRTGLTTCDNLNDQCENVGAVFRDNVNVFIKSVTIEGVNASNATLSTLPVQLYNVQQRFDNYILEKLSWKPKHGDFDKDGIRLTKMMNAMVINISNAIVRLEADLQIILEEEAESKTNAKEEEDHKAKNHG